MQQEARYLVGVGSLWRGDDRIGLDVATAAAARLRGSRAEPLVHFEAGADPLALLAEFERMGPTIIVDAADLGEVAGTVRVFDPDQAIVAIRRDPLVLHGFGLGEVLRLARATGVLPGRVRVVGIQPASIELGLDDALSAVLQERFAEYVDITCQEVLG